jgi:hypothetical protein
MFITITNGSKKGMCHLSFKKFYEELYMKTNQTYK